MTNDKSPITLTGLVRVREHCVFTWREPEGGGERSVDIFPTHCTECIKEIQQRGYRLVTESPKPPRDEGR